MSGVTRLADGYDERVTISPAQWDVAGFPGVDEFRAVNMDAFAAAVADHFVSVTDRSPWTDSDRLAHKLRDPKFYTARTKRAVNSLTIERGPKAVPHE